MELKWFHLSFVAVIFAGVALGVEIDCKKPPEDIDPDFCCSTPIFFDDQLVVQCERSLGWNDSLHYSEFPDDLCISECLMNKTQIIVNGHIDKNILHEKLLEKIRNGWWRSMLPEFIDTCMQAVGKDEEMAGYNPKSACKADALFMIDCIYLKLFGNCPEEIWKDTKKCQNLRDYIIKCTNQD
ncbi:general odorant-binding protein 67-like [Lutzomyia longipalpis]|uniref:Putative pheromone-binding protein-related protein 6 n=1 Tax=Lutzomyia longipalpis TaxID=7200 RepID=A0A1B0CHP6_LUTLO|nr:general odorant-binding protein 67-like [Lutzomyia longipalpis]